MIHITIVGLVLCLVLNAEISQRFFSSYALAPIRILMLRTTVCSFSDAPNVHCHPTHSQMPNCQEVLISYPPDANSIYDHNSLVKFINGMKSWQQSSGVSHELSYEWPKNCKFV